MKFNHLSAVVAVDQNPSRCVVTEILRHAGISDIRHANDGAMAVSLAAQRHPSFVVLDLEISHDGVRTLRQIRRSDDDGLRRVPVIMTTAAATRPSIEAMRDAGVNEIIVKPLTTAKLLGRIGAMLTHPRPFVECGTYVGPDRRRTNSPSYYGPLRRESDELDNVVEI